MTSSTNNNSDSSRARTSSQSDKVFIRRPPTSSVLGKRPAPGAVTAPTTHNGLPKPSEVILNPPTGPRSAIPQPPKASTSSMPPPPRPATATATSSMPETTRPFMTSTVFDNNHSLAPASLETIVGQPFHELGRHTWLRVRPEFSDVQKLLADAFLLRKGDNRVSNGPDRAKLGGGVIRG